MEQTIPPAADMPKATATFTFHNTGKKTIKIGNIKTSCQCVAVVMEKKEFGPGGSGNLELTIDRKGRTGNQTESARIYTSDGKESVVTFNIQTSMFLQVKPTFVIWKRGEAHKEREFEVEITEDKARVSELTVTTSNPAFETSVIPIEPGKRYRVQVSPKDSNVPGFSIFTIQTDFPQDKSGRIFAYGKVL